MKKCIALLMLATYLFAVGAPAYAAVTCHCVAEKSLTMHTCCSHCNHDNTVTGGKTHFEAPCCGDLHSTEIELYTLASQDAERYAKRIFAVDLPPAILAEPLFTVDYTPVYCNRISHSVTRSIQDTYISSCGLRAPPALV